VGVEGVIEVVGGLMIGLGDLFGDGKLFFQRGGVFVWVELH
jgi:hypothetical protein